MDDLTAEIEDIRFDITALRTAIDLTLDSGGRGDDITLQALANVLHDRLARLEQLERTAANAPRPDDDFHDAGQRAE